MSLWLRDETKLSYPVFEIQNDWILMATNRKIGMDFNDSVATNRKVGPSESLAMSAVLGLDELFVMSRTNFRKLSERNRCYAHRAECE